MIYFTALLFPLQDVGSVAHFFNNTFLKNKDYRTKDIRKRALWIVTSIGELLPINLPDLNYVLRLKFEGSSSFDGRMQL